MKEARDNVAWARVNELVEEMKEWKRLNPEYLFDERLNAIYKDKGQDLTNARADLDEAREYHLRLTQPAKKAKLAQDITSICYHELVKDIHVQSFDTFTKLKAFSFVITLAYKIPDNGVS